MSFISWLMSPFGRIFGAIGALLIAVLTIYGKGRQDARQKIEGEANADAFKRTQDAIRAGDAVNVSPDRVRDRDKHQRD